MLSSASVSWHNRTIVQEDKGRRGPGGKRFAHGSGRWRRPLLREIAALSLVALVVVAVAALVGARLGKRSTNATIEQRQTDSLVTDQQADKLVQLMLKLQAQTIERHERESDKWFLERGLSPVAPKDFEPGGAYPRELRWKAVSRKAFLQEPEWKDEWGEFWKRQKHEMTIVNRPLALAISLAHWEHGGGLRRTSHISREPRHERNLPQ